MNQKRDLKRTARLAGLLYLAWIITGIYGLQYIPSKTIVRGDPAASCNKILANEFLFRTGIINDIVSSIICLFLAFTLYRLLGQVNAHRAKLMFVMLVVMIPVTFIMDAFSITSLMISKGELLKSFDTGQRQELAYLFIKINDNGTMAVELYWGLWLLPFGLLVYRSVFIPRMFGVLLIVNGIAYIIHCIASILFPAYEAIIEQVSMPFWILGEISIMLWLLIKGVKDQVKNKLET